MKDRLDKKRMVGESTYQGLAIANVAPIATPKLEGAWYYIIIVYTLALTLILGFRLF